MGDRRHGLKVISAGELSLSPVAAALRRVGPATCLGSAVELASVVRVVGALVPRVWEQESCPSLLLQHHMSALEPVMESPP